MSDMEDIEKVIIHLLSNQGVFYASLLSQMRRLPDPHFPAAAGVTIVNGRIELHWNPELFSKIAPKLEEKRGILEHECLHLVMDHLTRIRGRDPKIWNIASDLAINQMIKELPKGCVQLSAFPPEWGLQPNRIAEVYYDTMYKNAPRIKMTKKQCGRCGGTGKEPQQGGGQGQGQGQSQKGDQKSDKGQGGKGKQKEQEGQGQGGGQCQQGDKPCKDCGGGQGGYHVEVFDKNGNKTGEFDTDTPGTHKKWKEGDSADMTEEVLKQAVAQAKEQAERNQGRLPGGLEQHINELLKPPVIPWWILLKKFIATKIKSGFKRSWKRPNRRFGEIQKGKRPDRKLKIIEIVDTSGSINIEDYQDFTNEMQGIQKIYKTQVTIIECDWDIQKVYELKPNKKVSTKFKGGGGTSFCKPFKYIEDKRLKPDLVIYFTDMYGDFPSKKPPYPVLWVSVSDIKEAPFGFVLPIQDHKPKKRRSY